MRNFRGLPWFFWAKKKRKQASFCHHQVRPKPLFLTKMIIASVNDVVAICQKLFLKAIWSWIWEKALYPKLTAICCGLYFNSAKTCCWT